LRRRPCAVLLARDAPRVRPLRQFRRSSQDPRLQLTAVPSLQPPPATRLDPSASPHAEGFFIALGARLNRLRARETFTGAFYVKPAPARRLVRLRPSVCRAPLRSAIGAERRQGARAQTRAA